MDNEEILYSLLVTVAVSEVLPLLAIHPNGILHAFVLGLRKVTTLFFKYAEKQATCSKHIRPETLPFQRPGDQTRADKERRHKTTPNG